MMANKKPRLLTANFNMALSPKDRKLIVRAAKVCDQPPSVWARGIILAEANKLLSQAKAAK